MKGLIWLGSIFAFCLMIIFFIVFTVKQYKRCPSNRVLVVFGKVGGARAAKCLHGGGVFVVPLVQDYEYLSLEPLTIEIPLEGALSLNNIRVNVPSTFTVGISTDPVLMSNAAERLLMLNEPKIKEQAQDIILGQLRLVIATLSIEEINKDREKFMALINENVTQEINKIGLELINVNIRDITDESGYIQAIGQRAAAEAINRAKVEVAEQDRDGATGQAVAVREQTVNVARERATAVEGEKKAERGQRVTVASLEAEAVTGEVESKRDREIATAQRDAETVAARKQAEQEQRVAVADAESLAVQGENTARAQIADSNAKLAEIQASADQRADVAAAKAREAILLAERERELARLSKEQLAPQEIDKQLIEIAAEAEAEKLRREARGEADAILARYTAEAEGVRKVLEAKAIGYRELVGACVENPQIAPTLLMIEKLPELVAEQVKAIQNLKIDKITVWDSGRNGQGNAEGSTAGFLSSLIGSLPAMHELANQAGIELPSVLGRLSDQQDGRVGNEYASAKPVVNVRSHDDGTAAGDDPDDGAAGSGGKPKRGNQA
ncbi:MAG: flotillin family protein [Planctomycetes bacterium]|nr:flotillin family protein [Planctomycetota bacterium]NOG53498.1 flotillin family protein [Planctomycetota bacterium]